VSSSSSRAKREPRAGQGTSGDTAEETQEGSKRGRAKRAGMAWLAAAEEDQEGGKRRVKWAAEERHAGSQPRGQASRGETRGALYK